MKRERARQILERIELSYAEELKRQGLVDQDGIQMDALRAFAKGTRVVLTYFKTSGKYYSEGEFVSLRDYWHEMIADVRDMQVAGRLPGLVDGCREFVVLIQPEEPWCVRHILQPPVGEGS